MKLTTNTHQKTKLGLKTREWEYHTTQIDTDDIKAIKVTAYDNAPDIKHMYEPNRYKVKVFVWLKGSDLSDKHDYEITNKLTRYKSYRNNMYKTDQYKNWYVDWVKNVKDLETTLGCTCVAGPLGMRQSTSEKSEGYKHVPKWAYAQFMTDSNMVGKLYIEDFEFDIEFDEEWAHKGTQCYSKELVFE